MAASTAGQVPIPVATGWTWTTTMGAVQNILLAGGGAGLGALGLRIIVALKRLGNERAKQDTDRDSGRWRELMELNDKLQVRIAKLEDDVRDERRRSDEEVALIRKQHVEEMTTVRLEHERQIKAFNERIDQLQRTIFQNQQSTATILAPMVGAERAREKLDKIKGPGE